MRKRTSVFPERSVGRRPGKNQFAATFTPASCAKTRVRGFTTVHWEGVWRRRLAAAVYRGSRVGELREIALSLVSVRNLVSLSRDYRRCRCRIDWRPLLISDNPVRFRHGPITVSRSYSDYRFVCCFVGAHVSTTRRFRFSDDLTRAPVRHCRRPSFRSSSSVPVGSRIASNPRPRWTRLCWTTTSEL